MSEYIEVGPNWESAAHMLAVVLVDGTPAGQAEAKQELIRMGRLLDSLIKERKADVAP